jgi:hypothetical protein
MLPANSRESVSPLYSYKQAVPTEIILRTTRYIFGTMHAVPDRRLNAKENPMLRKFSPVLVLAAFTALIMSTAAHATTLFTFNGDCSSIECFGGTYTVVVTDANDADSSTYTASLTINATGYDGGITPPVFIDAVDIKIVSGAATVDLIDAPGGTAGWTDTFNNGQAATDCGSGGGFFACARDEGTNSLAPVPGTHTWTWSFDTEGTIAFGHIGASYNNADGTVNGQNVSISDAGGTPGGGTPGGGTPGGGTPGGGTPSVPEPASIFLVASGLIALRGIARRFRKN